MKNITLISAGAGSGKTYRITEELSARLQSGQVRPAGVIATTFTRKAAAELAGRVRRRLLEAGQSSAAEAIQQARIGTVHSVCGQLLERFAFELGLSPRQRVLEEADGSLLFAQALEDNLDIATVRQLNALAQRLGRDGDWHRSILAIAEQGRTHGLTAAELTLQGQTGLAELLDFFPAATSAPDKQLLAAITAALTAIDASGDDKKITRDYQQVLREVQQELQADRLPWSQWVKLAKAQPAKASQPLAAPVQALAATYASHPGLRRDVTDWVSTLFRLAAAALQTYAQFKRQRGVVDFADQEQLALVALDHPQVRAVLAAELDLVIVDEFQDTSPIQLAIFLKLAELAHASIWVGDLKQAIYGFRGSAPQLMAAVADRLTAAGTPVDVLADSWRSQPALVQLYNALFTAAFSAWMPPERVRLTPQRQQQLPGAALERWQLEGNQSQQAAALAVGIQALLAEGQPVLDPVSGQIRPLRPGDIAVLSRSNEAVSGFAAALAGAGLPVSFGRAGLMQTPEVQLALACLRRLADEADTLASAEIVFLSEAPEPEQWLADRLAYLAAGGVSKTWRTSGDHQQPVLAALAAERARLRILTPAEALEQALTLGQVRATAVRWGPNRLAAAQRLANLEQLWLLAQDYEDHCLTQRRAATVSGLLLWLQGLAGQQHDEQAVLEGADAIQLLTYHKAKGLEWPLVICTALETKPRSRLWELQTVEAAQVDLNDPLAGRRLRYWPYPFGQQAKDIPLVEAIAASAVGRQAAAQAHAEEVRLLYVGLTRARDRLILAAPAKAKALPWLDSLGADWLQSAHEATSLTTPDGYTIPCRFRNLQAADAATATVVPEPLHWFQTATSVSPRLPAVLTPSQEPPCPQARIGQVLSLGPALPVTGQPDRERLGVALHHVIALEAISPGQTQRTAVAEALLARFGLTSVLAPAHALEAADRLLDWAQQYLGAMRFYAEWPVQTCLDNGQHLRGWVDLIAETGDGQLFIIDHKSFSGPSTDWVARALGYSGQLAAYRQAVAEAMGRPVAGTWIHFALGGGLVEVVFAADPADSPDPAAATETETESVVSAEWAEILDLLADTWQPLARHLCQAGLLPPLDVDVDLTCGGRVGAARAVMVWQCGDGLLWLVDSRAGTPPSPRHLPVSPDMAVDTLMATLRTCLETGLCDC